MSDNVVNYNPVNKITMKNMANLSNKVYNADRRLLASIPSKYHPLVVLYGQMAESHAKIDQHLDSNTALSFEGYHEIKELVQDANEAAATIKPMIPNELKETVMDAWSMIRGNREEVVVVEVTK
jgi:thiamine pyrophosphate-dependent acetolactate synthase large subunit-like protein